MQQGYAAVVAVLIVTGLIVVLGTAVTLTGISGLQTSQSRAYAGKALSAVESCGEEALIHLQDLPTLPGTVTNPLITCSVTVNSQVGTSWDFTVTGTLNNYTKSIQIQAERNAIISISSWKEVP